MTTELTDEQVQQLASIGAIAVDKLPTRERSTRFKPAIEVFETLPIEVRQTGLILDASKYFNKEGDEAVKVYRALTAYVRAKKLHNRIRVGFANKQLSLSERKAKLQAKPKPQTPKVQ